MNSRICETLKVNPIVYSFQSQQYRRKIIMWFTDQFIKFVPTISKERLIKIFLLQS